MTHFDLVVIGGGSGGVSCAKRAAGYGASVAVAEFNRWGGTCVNVGCVPKKMMWWCSTVGQMMKEAHHYGYKVTGHEVHDWGYMKRRRDFTINRLNGIYKNGLESAGVKQYDAFASIEAITTDGKVQVKVGGERVTADHVLLAMGGEPAKLPCIGSEFAINSDDFFTLEDKPKTCAVIGAGYIAVELAQIFQHLGTRTSLFFRKDRVLRTFDQDIQDRLIGFLDKDGLTLHPNTTPKEIIKRGDKELYIKDMNDQEHGPYECVLGAIGRTQRITGIGLEEVGVQFTPNGKYIKVDDYQNTTTANILALGDICGNWELTPVAIMAGRRLADRLFAGIKEAKGDYTDVPTVVFTHPPIGAIGLTEAQAFEKFGKENIQIYSNISVNLYYNAFDVEPSNKPRIFMKLICNKKDSERVVGLHCIGMGCDELLQGFGLGFKLGATKKDFDRVVAIHPSAAEEMVTMVPWGMTKDEMEEAVANSKNAKH